MSSSLVALLERQQPPGVVHGRPGVVDRARADHDHEARVRPGEDVGNRLPRRRHHVRRAVGDGDLLEQDRGRQQRPDLGDAEVVDTVQHGSIGSAHAGGVEIEVVGDARARVAERIDQQLNPPLRLGQVVHAQVDVQQIDVPGQLAARRARRPRRSRARSAAWWSWSCRARRGCRPLSSLSYSSVEQPPVQIGGERVARLHARGRRRPR